jgi:hypothetical protein
MGSSKMAQKKQVLNTTQQCVYIDSLCAAHRKYIHGISQHMISLSLSQRCKGEISILATSTGAMAWTWIKNP